MQHHFSQSILFDHKHILEHVDGRSKREKKIRLSIYRNNVFSSLIEALGEIYPVCKMLVGSQCFDALAYQYIQKTPPSNPILSEYGKEFPDFARHIPQLNTIPYLQELTRLEYQLLQLTHAAEEKTLSPKDIQQIITSFTDPTRTYWKLTPNLLLWKTTFAIGSIYMAHQPEHSKKLSQINWQKPEYLLLTKKGLYGHLYLISAEEWHLLSQLKLGHSFAQACAHLDEERLADMFAHMIQKPIIQNITPVQEMQSC